MYIVYMYVGSSYELEHMCRGYTIVAKGGGIECVAKGIECVVIECVVIECVVKGIECVAQGYRVCCKGSTMCCKGSTMCLASLLGVWRHFLGFGVTSGGLASISESMVSIFGL